MTTSFYIPQGSDSKRSDARGRIYAYLTKLPPAAPYVVLISEKKSTRSLRQNSTLWALYDDILAQGGEMLGGWERQDLHDFLLGSHYGWEELKALGRTRLKPLRRSSRMSKTDFSDHLEWICRFMAEKGIVLELPGELS